MCTEREAEGPTTEGDEERVGEGHVFGIKGGCDSDYESTTLPSAEEAGFLIDGVDLEGV